MIARDTTHRLACEHARQRGYDAFEAGCPLDALRDEYERRGWWQALDAFAVASTSAHLSRCAEMEAAHQAAERLPAVVYFTDADYDEMDREHPHTDWRY